HRGVTGALDTFLNGSGDIENAVALPSFGNCLRQRLFSGPKEFGLGARRFLFVANVDRPGGVGVESLVESPQVDTQNISFLEFLRGGNPMDNSLVDVQAGRKMDACTPHKPRAPPPLNDPLPGNLSKTKKRCSRPGLPQHILKS